MEQAHQKVSCVVRGTYWSVERMMLVAKITVVDFQVREEFMKQMRYEL